MKSGAIFSPCRTWRYQLWREWDKSKHKIMFVGLNPSTADETKDDPTVRRCINYAKAWGFGGMFMMNIFAFRATDPQDMKAVHLPIGPENDAYLLRTAAMSPLLIAAWGTHGVYRDRGNQVIELLDEKFRLYCMGKTKDGFPKHPLYLRKDVCIEPLTERRADDIQQPIDMSSLYPIDSN